jgi:hypothetical protein
MIPNPRKQHPRRFGKTASRRRRGPSRRDLRTACSPDSVGPFVGKRTDEGVPREHNRARGHGTPSTERVWVYPDPPTPHRIRSGGLSKSPRQPPPTHTPCPGTGRARRARTARRSVEARTPRPAQVCVAGAVESLARTGGLAWNRGGPRKGPTLQPLHARHSVAGDKEVVGGGPAGSMQSRPDRFGQSITSPLEFDEAPAV